MIIPGQRSLPLSVHNQFVITFTSTLFHINWLRQFSSPRETPYTHHNRQGLRVPDLRRYPSPGIGDFTLYWSSWFWWILLQLLPWIDIAPLPCLGCFCTALLCCLMTWATHSHPFRAPVYCGCQPGPTGVLIHPGRAVDQQCANPLAAALLLHCTELYTCVRVRPY